MDGDIGAKLLDVLGDVAGAVGPMFGAPGAIAGKALQGFLSIAALQVQSGTTIEELTARLKPAGKLDMPWDEGPSAKLERSDK
jgi:hypothetical protein